MITIKDLAKNLISKHQVSAQDGELFIQQMVEVINDGLLRDRMVKIKGFGTFKLQQVKERVSVNVNTGERVTIGEHDKITFTPDNTMKDLINKPFSQFETVIVADDSPLLDGSYEISYDDEEEEEEEITEPVVENNNTPVVAPVVESKAEPVAESKVELVTEPKVDLVSVPKDTLVVEPTPVTETVEQQADGVQMSEAQSEEDALVSDGQPEEQHDDQPNEQPENQPDEQPEDDNSCSRQYPHCRNIFIYYGIIINIVVALIAFAIGYLVANHSIPFFDQKQEVTMPVVKKHPVTPKPVAKVTDTTTKPVAKSDSTEKASEETLPKEDVPMKQFDTDARVRTGAYYIMGTEKEVTATEGQTLKSISKRNLGPGLECYTEAYNDYKEVKAGDKVKIPKLKLKKLVNKHKAKK